MIRALFYLLALLGALAAASVAVALFSPTSDERETQRLRAQLDSATAELEIARDAHNALFTKLGQTEAACVRSRGAATSRARSSAKR